MSIEFRHHVNVALNREGVIRRRDFVRGMSAGALAAGSLGWTDLVSLQADELRKQGMSCILLWMGGGPSQLETFDPKPGHEHGGETKAISTSVAGIQIADNLPHMAKVADQLTILRNLTTKEGNHQRAAFLLHTSYVPTASVNYPTLGAVVSQQIQQAECELPAFVRVGRFLNSGNGGFLGTEHDAFVVSNADRVPDNVNPAAGVERYGRRLQLLDRLESASAPSSTKSDTYDHQKLYEHASRMILSPQMQAFDLKHEPDKMRQAYGKTEFGNGCLLARRLVEAGVPFVEVSLGNWDTHDNNFERTRALCGQLDQPFAALIGDLRERGMLDRTLIIWMGEFGRTPKVNPRGGRDHFPRAFNAVLAGGGVRGGQVIGATSPGGDEVTSGSVNEKDLFQTFYKCLKIDARKENMSPIGRPIKIVDGGKPIPEVFA
jgi:hypothetical protein